MLDYLAYFIILMAVIFIVFPLLGWQDNYFISIAVGFGMCIIFALCILIPCSIVWALGHVFN